jgi:hypothetical protein
MEYYILENKKMPWGDYGNILFEGLLNSFFFKKIKGKYAYENVMVDLDFPELERTGPYIPEIHIPGGHSTNLIVVNKVKILLEKSNLTGINNYKKVIYKKIVNLNWQEWDMNEEKPLIYPKGGSPENYILKNKHDENLIEVMPEIWLMEIDKKNELKKASEKTNNNNYYDIQLEGIPENDIFIPKNMLFIIVSENFKKIMEDNNINTLRYINIR